MIFKKNMQGFSLIELMVVVVIVGILAAIAIPSYNEQVTKARRAEAKSALMELVSRQERFYTQYLSYTEVISPGGACAGIACGLNMSSDKSENGYYSLSVNGTPNGCAPGGATLCSGFEMTATALQTDSKCTSISITNTGVRRSTGSETSKFCWK